MQCERVHGSRITPTARRTRRLRECAADERRRARSVSRGDTERAHLRLVSRRGRRRPARVALRGGDRSPPHAEPCGRPLGHCALPLERRPTRHRGDHRVDLRPADGRRSGRVRRGRGDERVARRAPGCSRRRHGRGRRRAWPRSVGVEEASRAARRHQPLGGSCACARGPASAPSDAQVLSGHRSSEPALTSRGATKTQPPSATRYPWPRSH